MVAQWTQVSNSGRKVTILVKNCCCDEVCFFVLMRKKIGINSKVKHSGAFVMDWPVNCNMSDLANAGNGGMPI